MPIVIYGHVSVKCTGLLLNRAKQKRGPDEIIKRETEIDILYLI